MIHRLIATPSHPLSSLAYSKPYPGWIYSYLKNILVDIDILNYQTNFYSPICPDLKMKPTLFTISRIHIA